MNDHQMLRIRLVALSVLSLAAGTLWTVLISLHVTTTDPPEFTDGAADVWLERWYAWLATTMPQERAATALLWVGLAGVLVAAIRFAITSKCLASTVAAVGIGGGAALWGVIDLAENGSRRAIEQLADSRAPIEAVNAVGYATEVTAGWAQSGACLILAAGLAVASSVLPTARWRVACLATAAAAVVLAVLTLAEVDGGEYAGLVLGAVLLPWWTWTAWTVGDPPAPTASPADPARQTA